MREGKSTRCGWEVLTSSGRRTDRHEDRSGRGVLSWLNLMPGSSTELGRGSGVSDEVMVRSSGHLEGSQPMRRDYNIWRGVELDIDEILEAPLDCVGPVENRRGIEMERHQPFIQSEFRQDLVLDVVGGRAEPLHLFHTIRNRKHVLQCFEFLLMRQLDIDHQLWIRLCERFGYCDQCEQEGDCVPRSPRHSSHMTGGYTGAKDPFAINSIHPDLWFLAITLQESKDKLIHFIRSEMPRRTNEPVSPPKTSLSITPSFLSSYLNSFNFVELNLDSVFKHGEVGLLPKEIFRCINVKTLSLRHNFLDTLPPDIGRLAKLERLFLTNNRLQNKSIPFTIAFCLNLTELYIDNNLLDALPGIFLRLHSLERVHRHGNHNYFKATFMWYHTDINDRILQCPGAGVRPVREERHSPDHLQRLCGLTVIKSRINFFSSRMVPNRIKDYICMLCEGLELCSSCSIPQIQTEHSYKVFTFKNPYLGNTCVPFQHWACSLHCARAVEIPARREQISQAREQDRQYELYVKESVSRLRPSQRALSVNSLLLSESSGGEGGGSQLHVGDGGGSQHSIIQPVQPTSNVSCGIL